MQCFGVLVFLLSVTLTLGSVSSRGDPRQYGGTVKQGGNKDQGAMENCAKDKVPHLSLTWTPREIQLGGNVVVSFDMTVTEDLNGGHANLTVWLPQYPDPIFNQNVPFTCDDIHKAVPLLCPFKKGQQIKMDNMKIPLTPKYPIPQGTYKIRAEIHNQSNAVFACLQGTIVIKASDMEGDYMGGYPYQ